MIFLTIDACVKSGSTLNDGLDGGFVLCLKFVEPFVYAFFAAYNFGKVAVRHFIDSKLFFYKVSPLLYLIDDFSKLCFNVMVFVAAAAHESASDRVDKL